MSKVARPRFEQPNMWISATKTWELNQETAGFTMKLELRQTTFWILPTKILSLRTKTMIICQ